MMVTSPGAVWQHTAQEDGKKNETTWDRAVPGLIVPVPLLTLSRLENK